MARFISYLKSYWKRFTVAIFILVASVVFDMFNPLITKSIIDDVIEKGHYELFNKLIILLIGIIVLRSILGYIREVIFDDAGTRVTLDMRKDMFKHLQTLSFNYFDKMNTGKIMSRIKEDVDNVHRASSFGIMLVVEQMLYFIIALVIMFTLNWKLALISLVTLPIIAFLALRFEKKIGETFGKISDQTAKLNTIAQENISGVRLVKAFAREKYEIKKFLEHNENYYQLNVEQANIIADYHPRIEFLSNILIVIITIGGGYLVIGENISVGTLIAFSGYTGMVIQPMRMIGWLADVLAQCRASLKKIDTIFDQEPDIVESEDAVDLGYARGNIEFKNVTFKYGDTTVLKDINIKAKKGQSIAIMGTTGAGKTSLINLIGRYYDVNEGAITFDGIDIRDIKLESLRKQISVVMQDTFLFSDTINQNIKFSNSDMGEEDIISIAKKSEVHPFVDEMEQRYDTVIGERGLGLSGGQKQRISIARAIANNSKILIFDDATSALDMETEGKIQKSIKELKDVTKFIIAHRISAVKDADEILIMEDGEIVERGNHHKLLDLKGRYYELYQDQYAGLI